MTEIIIEKIANISNDISDIYLTHSDRLYIDRLTAKRRKEEVRAWRSVLRRKLSDMCMVKAAQSEILYNDIGAPYIADCELFISVSHSSTHIAIIISDQLCAIDIESTERNFSRVASRYATDRELNLASQIEMSHTLLLPLLWSAKETLYKFSNTEGLDLLKDLTIKDIEPNTSTLTGSITPHTTIIRMRYFLLDNHIIVHTTPRPLQGSENLKITQSPLQSHTIVCSLQSPLRHL